MKRTIHYAIERKKVESALKTSESRLSTITSVLGEGLLVLDKDGRLTLMNPEAEKLLGCTESGFLGEKVLDMICPSLGGAETDCIFSRTLASGLCHRNHEDAFLRKDGSSVPVSYVSTPLMKSNAVVGAVIAFHDISERKQHIEALRQANELLVHQATTDTLTGIYNRLTFNELLDSEMKRAFRYAIPLSLIMFDLDHFKKVNDTYGHNTGERWTPEIGQSYKV